MVAGRGGGGGGWRGRGGRGAGQVLGTRYVEIFKSSTQDLTQYFQNRAAGGRGPAIMPGTFPPRAPAPAAPLAA